MLLDSASVSPDTILLLDTFFHVVVFHGEKIAMWRDQGYQDHAEHIHFKQLLIAPQTDAQRIMDQRFPVPRYIVCDQHKSEARFVIAKLNPSLTHNTNDGSVGERIFTDDVSLRVFMEVSQGANEMETRLERVCWRLVPAVRLCAVCCSESS